MNHWRPVKSAFCGCAPFIALVDGVDRPRWSRLQPASFHAARLDCRAVVLHYLRFLHGAGAAPEIQLPRRDASVLSATLPSAGTHLLGDVAHHLDNDVEISTCSTFYRRALLGPFPPWFRQLGMCDVPMRALLAQKGDIGFLDEVMGVYRIHAGGIWSVGQMVWASPVLEYGRRCCWRFMSISKRISRGPATFLCGDASRKPAST